MVPQEEAVPVESEEEEEEEEEELEHDEVYAAGFMDPPAQPTGFKDPSQVQEFVPSFKKAPSVAHNPEVHFPTPVQQVTAKKVADQINLLLPYGNPLKETADGLKKAHSSSAKPA